MRLVAPHLVDRGRTRGVVLGLTICWMISLSSCGPSAPRDEGARVDGRAPLSSAPPNQTVNPADSVGPAGEAEYSLPPIIPPEFPTPFQAFLCRPTIPPDCVPGVARLAAEREALVALYNSTDGDNWTSNRGWLLSADPCSWFGVMCSSGHVTVLSLSVNNLTGSIPTDLGNLTSLELLALGSNSLTGSIPADLGNRPA